MGVDCADGKSHLNDDINDTLDIINLDRFLTITLLGLIIVIIGPLLVEVLSQSS